MNDGTSPGNNKAISPVVDFTAGVIAGAAGLVVGQPFDVIKVRYQTPEFNGRYSSVWRTFGAIVREEKVHGLFKGVWSPMAGIAFINGVVFSSYSLFMRFQHPSTENDSEPSLSQICLAGAGSGVVAASLTCPIELIKVRQQSAPPHLDPSIVSILRSIVRTEGVRGLYRGFSATALRDIAYGPYFCTYEAVCRYFRNQRKPPATLPANHHGHGLIQEAEAELGTLRWPELMTAGGLAGLAAWLTTFPFDVLKTRMQGASWEERSSVKALSLHRTAVNAVRAEGWRVCFAGLGPTLIRAVPVNMVIFLTFEACVAAL
ncbi:hypothetical protein TREMEDRAFT_71447 [Tremella mesenterica DSM 1558]|uniref:uncharacterized protein n=1 Tax=Tremella mesenterica (strain ATCC 24925 / CBS 8224 / DSM 1558 / NBRC 9311 / NRRL Y-6157 / RJB 2259-6 / UBC 559-6) TaxID=578456 RepID=UPI0003F4A51F|nr:uncharacterized protein TREMEDRAFT_71447 [Tremella mesenterica DSM 1558]EIW69903.1 hypothetical protein TREMEDRAFT_71447 [Tremella mesenterica DSM 1558]